MKAISPRLYLFSIVWFATLWSIILWGVIAVTSSCTFASPHTAATFAAKGNHSKRALLPTTVCSNASGLTVTARHFGVAEGLSQRFVYCSFQDHLGIMWFGTRDGLNRFDGYTFTSYRYQPFGKNSLSGNVVRTIQEDQHGDLWIGTHDGGLNRFTRSTGVFETFRHKDGDKSSIPSDDVYALLFDSNHRLWVGTTSGIAYLDSSSRRFITITPDDLHVRYFLEDGTGHIWVATNSGVGCIDKRTMQYSSRDDLVGDTPCESISSDHFGRLWFSCDNRLVCYSPLNGSQARIKLYLCASAHEYDSETMIVGCEAGLFSLSFRDISKADCSSGDGSKTMSAGSVLTPVRTLAATTDLSEEGIGLQKILSIYKAHDGGLWVGGLDGITHISRASSTSGFLRVSHSSGYQTRALENDVRSFCETSRGELLVGTRAGLRIRNADGSFGEPSFASFLSGIPINVILEDRHHFLWLGTTSHGLYRLDPLRKHRLHYMSGGPDSVSTISKSVWAICEDSLGTIWVGTSWRWTGVLRYSLSKYRPQQNDFCYPLAQPQLPSLRENGAQEFIGASVWSILAAPDNSLWLATSDGLVSYDPALSSVTHFRNVRDDSCSISHNEVWSLHLDRTGSMWTGTWGGGLNRLSTQPHAIDHAGLFEHFTANRGLTSNIIYGMAEDDGGKLWISTSKGIFVLQTSKPIDPIASTTARSFVTLDGVLEQEYNPNAVLRTHSGEILFGGSKGITVIRHSMEEPRRASCLLITSFHAAGEGIRTDLPDSATFDLPYTCNNFTATFSALNFADPLRDSYSYKLDGVDEEWQHAGSRHELNYSHLTPGLYVLHITSDNAGTSLGGSRTLFIRIASPFWKTANFGLAIVGFLAFLGIVTFRRRAAASRSLAIALEDARDNERRDIASDLHDGPLQELFSARFLLEDIARPVPMEAKHVALAKLDQHLSNARTAIRNACGILHPPLLDGRVEPELRRYVESVAMHLADIQIVIEDISEIRTMSASMGRNVFRVFRIALLNAINHSKCTTIRIRFTVDDSGALLEVEDDGCGFTLSKAALQHGRHYGMLLASTYARAVSGDFEIIPGNTSGTLVRYSIPIARSRMGWLRLGSASRRRSTKDSTDILPHVQSTHVFDTSINPTGS